MMKEFLEYVSGLHPEFNDTIHGATPAEIMQLQELVGHKLPRTYKEFLTYMGQEVGSLRLAWDCNTDVRDLVAYYRDEVARGEADIPHNCIIIGLGGVVVEEIALEIVGDREPHVVVSGDGEVQWLYAESLEKLLYRQAFMTWELPRFPNRMALVTADPERLLQPAQAIAGSFGFEKLWFSDTIAYCATRVGALIAINQFDNEGLTVQIWGQNAGEIEEVGERFATEFSLTRQTDL